MAVNQGLMVKSIHVNTQTWFYRKTGTQM